MSEETTTLPVVVGVDGSDTSLRALEWAAREASWMHAPLQVVTAWTFPDSPAPLDIPIQEPYQDELIKKAQEKLNELVGKYVPIDMETKVLAKVIRGSATRVLLTESEDAQLLVVGRRGCGSLRHALTGSVSERCVRHALCPVTVVT